MKYEIRKWLNLRLIFLVVLLLALNLVFFAQTIRHRERMILQDYDDYTALLSGELSPDQFDPLSPVAIRYRQQEEALSFYPEYIETMPQRAADAAALQNTGSAAYRERNLAKTVRDFSGLEDLPLSLGRDASVTSPFDFVLTDLFVIALMAYIVTQVFTYEFESSLYPLILAVPGRRRIARAKLSFITVSAGLLCLLFYASNIIASGLIFGFDQPGRYVQSIAAFRGTPFPLTVRGYFILAIAWKWLNLLALAFCLFALYTCIKKALYALPLLALCWVVAYLLYRSIPPNSDQNFFHFVNLVHGLDAYNLLRNYQNVNLFSHPVSLMLLWPLLCLLLLLASTLVVHLQYQSTQILRSPAAPRGLQARADQLSRRWSHRHSAHGLFFFETNKSLFAGRAIWIFLLLILLSYNQLRTAYIFRGSDQKIYDSLIEKLPSVVSEQTLELIDEERTQLLQSGLPDEMNQTALMAIDRVEAQAHRVLELASVRGIEPHLINEDVYAFWMDNPDQDFRDLFFSFFAAILASAGISARENTVDAKKLLRITPAHRRLRRAKIGLTVLYSLLTCVISAVTRLLIFRKFFDFSSLSAPIPNFRGWEAFYFDWPLWAYFVLLLFFRLFAALSLACVIAAVSSRAKTESIAVVILSALCLLPAIALHNGIRGIQWISLAWAAEANPLINSHPVNWLWVVTLYSEVIVLSIDLINREWQPQRP